MGYTCTNTVRKSKNTLKVFFAGFFKVDLGECVNIFHHG